MTHASCFASITAAGLLLTACESTKGTSQGHFSYSPTMASQTLLTLAANDNHAPNGRAAYCGTINEYPVCSGI